MPRIGKRIVNWIAILIALISVGTSVSCSLIDGIIPASKEQVPTEITAEYNASNGTVLSLSDGACLEIPAGSLDDGVTVSLKQVHVDESVDEGFEHVIRLGDRYSINLGGYTLKKAATLTLPFDPEKLPKEMMPDQAFLVYFDDSIRQWLFAGGQVNTSNNTIVLQIQHASLWEPSSWNWEAWVAILEKTLSGTFVDIFEGVSLLTEDCAQQGENAWIEIIQEPSLLQGCIEEDDPLVPQFRVVNPKAFFFEVRPISGQHGYFEQTLLSPGEGLSFKADASDPYPFVVAAQVTEKAGRYLLVHMLIKMMPGLSQINIGGSQVACLTERLHDSSYILSAAEALIVDQNGAAAAENIIRFLRDENTVRRFITTAEDCFDGPARTWSVKGIQHIGEASSTILSACDYTVNYIAGTAYSEVEFWWYPYTQTEECPVEDETFCEFIRLLEPSIAKGDLDALLQYSLLQDCLTEGSGWYDFDPESDCREDDYCVPYGMLQAEGGCTPLWAIHETWNVHSDEPIKVIGIIYPQITGIRLHDPLDGPAILVQTSDEDFDWIVMSKKIDEVWMITAYLLESKGFQRFENSGDIVIPWP